MTCVNLVSNSVSKKSSRTSHASHSARASALVTPSLTSDTEYTVYAHEYQREVRYEIIETDDGISVM